MKLRIYIKQEVVRLFECVTEFTHCSDGSLHMTNNGELVRVGPEEYDFYGVIE